MLYKSSISILFRSSTFHQRFFFRYFMQQCRFQKSFVYFHLLVLSKSKKKLHRINEELQLREIAKFECICVVHDARICATLRIISRVHSRCVVRLNWLWQYINFQVYFICKLLFPYIFTFALSYPCLLLPFLAVAKHISL